LLETAMSDFENNRERVGSREPVAS
jgi:hypothetical protein